MSSYPYANPYGASAEELEARRREYLKQRREDGIWFRGFATGVIGTLIVGALYWWLIL